MALGIRRARIRDYKLFRDLLVDFPGSRLLVLVGANGAGKSSLLEALELPLRLARLDPGRDGLNNAYYSPLGELFSGAHDPRRVLPEDRREARLSVRLELEGGNGWRWGRAGCARTSIRPSPR